MRNPFRKTDHMVADHRGQPVRVESGRVLVVDDKRFTCDVQPEGEPYLLRGLALLFPVAHADGSGLYFLPEVGASVLVLYYSYGPPYVLCARSTPADGGFRGKLRPLKAGDIALQTADHNGLLLRRSGMMELRASPILRMALFPHTGTLFARSERMELRTMGGQWLWDHHRQGEGLDPLSPTAPAGRATLTEEYQPTAGDSPHLTITHGWHKDGTLYRIAYDNPYSSDADTIGTVNRKVYWSLGDLDEAGRRHRVNVDDESYVHEVGETDDGSVRYEKIAPRDKPLLGDRPWQITRREGNVDGTMVRLTLERDGDDKLDLMLDEDGSMHLNLNEGVCALDIEEDGRVSLNLNEGVCTLTISAEGAVDLDTQGAITATTDEHVHVVSSDIRLGSGEADEPLVLGNAWKALYNEFIRVFRSHTHISNMGSPTGPPLQPTKEMLDTHLSDVSFTERQG